MECGSYILTYLSLYERMSLHEGIIQEDFDFIIVTLLTLNSLSLQSYLTK